MRFTPRCIGQGHHYGKVIRPGATRLSFSRRISELGSHIACLHRDLQSFSMNHFDNAMETVMSDSLDLRSGL